MPEYPTWSPAPAPRCFHLTGDPQRPICGELARWRSAQLTSGVPSCRCDLHQLSTDVPIAGEQLQRRVRVYLVVDLAGAAASPSHARTEAVERLRLAAERAGGVVNLVDATAEVGLARVQPRPGQELAGGGRG